MSDLINRQAMLKYAEKKRKEALMMDDLHEASIIMAGMDLLEEAARNQQVQQLKCLSCGHHIAERPFEVYCNIMCKWVNEKDCCTMFEPGHKCQIGEENG